MTIRNQIKQLGLIRPIKFSTSFKDYLKLKKKIGYIRDNFNQLIDEYISNINKLSISTKNTWVQDFANLKI
jgi:hypothetical protein